MLAVVIAAWHEDAVLGEVVDNLVASAQYPRSLYRVFLGVYPNDAATVAVARALEARHGGTVVQRGGRRSDPRRGRQHQPYRAGHPGIRGRARRALRERHHP
ncbi:MAG: glycosyltransferase [Eggerthellaceae bacterium]